VSYLIEYIAAGLLNSANHSGNAKQKITRFIREDYEQYRGSISKIVREVQGQFGHHVNEEDIENALTLLHYFAAAEPEFSPAARSFWNIKFDNFRYYFIESEPGPADDPAQYLELRTAAEQQQILMAYGRLGSVYIEDAIEHISQMSADEIAKLRTKGFLPTNIPASDRVVTLLDNQQSDLEDSSTELILAVEKQNSVDGDQSLRQQIIGQLKAGRELVRAGVFRVALIEQTFLSVLGRLIEKYKDQVIGNAAKKLFDLLIEHVVGK
jgi:hypothetical protein